IVVEHLLEMGHQPACVDRITREAAAEMVVDPALGHLFEGAFDRRAKVRPVRPLPGAPQQLEDRGLRKFGCAADAAMDSVDLLQEPLGELIDEGLRNAVAPLGTGEAAKRLLERGDVARNLLGILAIDAAEGMQDLRETGPAPA